MLPPTATSDTQSTSTSEPDIRVPIPIALPHGRPRCRQAVIDTPDGQCQYQAISAAAEYCYTHRRAHNDDRHTLVIPNGNSALAYARCYDGYHAKWRGRVDLAPGQSYPPGASTSVPALYGHAKCALILPYPGLPHALHVDSPAYLAEMQRRKDRAMQGYDTCP